MLLFEDHRAAGELLGKGAQKEFKNFSGNISFSLARGKESGFKMGIYDLPSLFTEAFKRRLKNLGIEVVSEREEGKNTIIIDLKEFLLDLKNRKWVVSMEYEAKLETDGKVLAKQMISGQAERVKLIGRKQADVVLGEIFTELVNKLDVGRLFQQAGL